MATKAKRTKRQKPGYLPGMEPLSIKAIDAAADIYYEAMQERITLSRVEDEAKDNLIDKMTEAGTDRYETACGLIVDITNKKNVKCKKKKDKSEENGDGHEE